MTDYSEKYGSNVSTEFDPVQLTPNTEPLNQIPESPGPMSPMEAELISFEDEETPGISPPILRRRSTEELREDYALFSDNPNHRFFHGYPLMDIPCNELPSLQDMLKSRMWGSIGMLITTFVCPIIFILGGMLYINALTQVGRETAESSKTNDVIIHLHPLIRNLSRVYLSLAPWRKELLPVLIPGSVSLYVGICLANGFPMDDWKWLGTSIFKPSRAAKVLYLYVTGIMLWLFSVMFGWWKANHSLLILSGFVFSFLVLLVWFPAMKNVYYAAARKSSPRIQLGLLPKIRNADDAFPHFLYWSLSQSIGFLFSLYVYQIFVVQWFFQSTTIWEKMGIRLILHPVLFEIAFLPYRIYTLYLNYCFAEMDAKIYNWFFFPIPAQLIFSLYGRFMTSILPEFWEQILLAGFLACQDQIFRSSMQFRDALLLQFMTKLVNLFKKCSYFFERCFSASSTSNTHVESVHGSMNSIRTGSNHPKSTSRGKPTIFEKICHPKHISKNTLCYAYWYLTDEICEFTGIIAAPFIVVGFKIATDDKGSMQTWDQLLGVALITLAFEVCGDVIRTIFYFRANCLTKALLLDTNTEETIGKKLDDAKEVTLRVRIHLFWRSVEYAIHEAYISRPKWFFKLIVIFQSITSLYLYHSFFILVLCGAYSPTEQTLKYTYTC